MATGYDYSWFVLTQSIIKKEFALSGSEQNPDLTSKSWRMTARRALNKGAPAPVEAFKTKGADFIVRGDLADLVEAMNVLAGSKLLEFDDIRRQIEARDRQIDNPYVKDIQVMGIHNARALYRRPADPHRKTASHSRPRAWPADRRAAQHPDAQDARRLARPISTRACLARGGEIMPGLYAAGEAQVSAAAACTAIARWKAPSSAAACSRAATPAVPRRKPWGETRS